MDIAPCWHLPSPITNSGRADGGWMDRIGITTAGLGHIFFAPYPVECFYSNDAYRKEGFCTMQLELHPVFEEQQDSSSSSSTPEGLTRYLQAHVHEAENAIYQSGDYRVLEEVPKVIEDPTLIGSSATLIVQHAYEVRITPGPNLSAGLTATTIASLLYFRGKGNVIFKASNFERHHPPLDHTQLLASIEFQPNAPAVASLFGGDDQLSSRLRDMQSLLEQLEQQQQQQQTEINNANSNEENDDDEATKQQQHARQARVQAAMGTVPQYCLQCGVAGSSGGGGGKSENDVNNTTTSSSSTTALLKCSKCKVAVYCCRDCQKLDWKRHKKTECKF